MNIRKLSAACIFTLCLAISASGQDLHVYYDAQADTVSYEYNGKAVKNPKVKKGGYIFLHVQNYNNYLYDANVKANNKEIKLPSSAGNNPLIGGIMPMQGGKNAPNFNLIDMAGFKAKNVLKEWLDEAEPSAGDGDVKGFGASSTDAEEEFNQLKAELNSTLSNLENIESEFKDIGTAVTQEVKARKIRGIAITEIDKLKYNPHLSPKQIKKMSEEYLNKVFKKENPEEISLDYAMELSDVKSAMEKHMKELKVQSANYEEEAKKLDKLSSKVGGVLGYADAEMAEFNSQIFQAQVHILEVQETVNKDMKSLKKLAEEDSGSDLNLINALRTEFEILKENDFTRTYRAPAKGDYVSFDLSFAKRDSTRKIGTPHPVSEIEVPVAGGFKINASLGISFGQFADQPHEYFVRDDKIVSSDNGNFLPILTSFLHFYVQGARSTSFGGTLGMGFPVVNTGNDQSLYFFFGPSLIMGKGSRIVITGGVMGGKVKRLGAGYALGDTFTDDTSVLPIISKYELGYFLGLSYNLGN